MSDKLLTIKEAADYLKVHWQTVRNYVQTGKIKAAKVGRRIRILESDLKVLLGVMENKKQELEVEIRFLTKNRQKIEGRLLKLGAKVVCQGHVIDHWYIPSDIKNIDEKNDFYESGRGYGLRVREQDNGYTGKIVATLEVKRLAYPYKHDTCIEQEMGIDSYEEADKLLRLINHKEMTTLDKDRLVYKLDDYKVVIDDIRGYKVGVEIELMTDENRENVLPRLRRIAGQIGLDTSKEITEKSVTFLYMQEYSKF